MTDLTDVSSGQIITSARQNLINDYLQDGTHGITTLRISATDNTTTTGNVGYFARNLDSTNTNDAVVYVLNDNVNDDQCAVKVKQDGVNNAIDSTVTSSYWAGWFRDTNDNNYASFAQGLDKRTAIFYRNLDSTGTNAEVVKIHQDHASDDQIALLVQQDGAATCISSDIYNTTTDYIYGVATNVWGADTTGTANARRGVFSWVRDVSDTKSCAGYFQTEGAASCVYVLDNGVIANYVGALEIYSNAVQSNTNSALLRYRQDNSSSTGKGAYLINDGTGANVYIEQGGDGVALNISSSATTNPGIYVDVNSSSAIVQLGDYSDAIATNYFYRNVDSTITSAAVVKMVQDHASDDQNDLSLQNDGTGNSIYIDHNGASTCINIDSETNSFPMILGDQNATSCKFYLGNVGDADGTYYFKRNVDSTIAGAPVLGIKQDHASDNHAVLSLQQDASAIESVYFIGGTVAMNFATTMNSTGGSTPTFNTCPGSGAVVWINCEINGTTGWIPFVYNS